MRLTRYLHALAAIALPISLIGCASTGTIIDRSERPMPTGVYYEVQRGDTLWRIAKLYEKDVDEIVKANRLPSATKIDVGQKLFIPGASENNTYATASNTRPFSGKFSWPVVGKVTSHFGEKNGLVKNKGINIEAREGSKVVAADSGVVSFIDENMKGLGKTIIIDHENGFSTVYAHNSSISVNVGQKIERNQVIAYVGKTGRAEKPYLHFQIRKGHEPINPFYYLP
ncbi:MAG: peptidoglycan DD-metalloendopeptidase family protein [Candidatus Omnitrophica bacterium]|nr:peptidoglycan DD-metalloendopeptidase family protein [Candidatus Omnitrophota bacterium]